MTISQARKTLKDAGINWTWYMDLRQELLKEGHTPQVRQALYRLCDYILHG